MSFAMYTCCTFASHPFFPNLNFKIRPFHSCKRSPLLFFGSLCGPLSDPFMIIQSFKLYVQGSQSSPASLVLWSTTEATMLDGLVEFPLTMIAGQLYVRRKSSSNRGVILWRNKTSKEMAEE